MANRPKYNAVSGQRGQPSANLGPIWENTMKKSDKSPDFTLDLDLTVLGDAVKSGAIKVTEKQNYKTKKMHKTVRVAFLPVGAGKGASTPSGQEESMF